MENNKDLITAINSFYKAAHQLKREVRREAKENKRLVNNLAKDLRKEINSAFREYKLNKLASGLPDSKAAIAKVRREKMEIKRNIQWDAQELHQEVRDIAATLTAEINALKQKVEEAVASYLQIH